MSQRELRRAQRLSMVRIDERLSLSFARGDVEMRAKPNGTAAGSAFEWTGYAAVYDADFPMYDRMGDPYTESVAQGACKRSLANPNLDVPFVFGHSEWGIPFARTKSGTMQLSEDSHGLHVHVPSMDGRREEVRALASAVERGDVSEMSLAFICNRQEWDDDFEHRTVAEMDLNRGDVSAVIHGANPATDGASMFPVEQLMFRRPAVIGGPVLLGRERRAAMSLAFICLRQAWDDDFERRTVLEMDVHRGDVCAVTHGANPATAGSSMRAVEQLSFRRPAVIGGPVLLGRERRAAASLAEQHGHPGRPCFDPDGDGDCDLTPAGDTDHDYWTADGQQVKPLPDQRSESGPYELRASAADSIDIANSPDYNPDVACPQCQAANDADANYCDQCGKSMGQSATVTVDGTTGIPGEESQFSEQQRREWLVRELELEELAHAR